jgi:hypothetical protein
MQIDYEMWRVICKGLAIIYARTIFLIAVIFALFIPRPALAYIVTSDGYGHLGGSEYSGRGLQNENPPGSRRDGFWWNDRWYAHKDWCRSDRGSPFRCD